MNVLVAKFVWTAGEEGGASDGVGGSANGRATGGTTAHINTAIRSARGTLRSLHRGLDGAAGYAYIDAAANQGGDLRAVLEAILGHISLVELELIQEIAGASAGQPAPIHYVVETDVLPEAEADCTAWYFEEHLPGLASVPGVVRAARYRNTGALDTGPRSHAIYDMVSRDTFETPPWLKVRHSPWTARVVPMWRNTSRTMFRRLMG